MMSDSDSENMGEEMAEQMNDAVWYAGGVPTIGADVTVEYDSRAGGAFGTDGFTTITGELVEIRDTYHTLDNGHKDLIIAHPGRSRYVKLTWEPDMDSLTLKSLAGEHPQRLGRVESVEFGEDVREDAAAPVRAVVQDAGRGDTIILNGEEWGVYRDRAGLLLTRGEWDPDGDGMRRLSVYSGNVTFSVYGGEELELDHHSVQIGRRASEDTASLLPNPFQIEVGDRVTVTVRYAGEDGSVSEDITGEVAGVDALTEEFRVRADDGREVHRDTSYSNGVVRITYDGVEVQRCYSFDVEPAPDVETDGGVVGATGAEVRDAVAGVEQGDGLMTDGGVHRSRGTPEVGDRVDVEYQSHDTGGVQTRNGEVVSVDAKGGDRVQLAVSQDRENSTLIVNYADGDALGMVSVEYTAKRNTTEDTVERRVIGSVLDVETVTKRLMSDGGVDPEALASAVSQAFADSTLSVSAVSVSVGEVDSEVTVQGSGPLMREGWIQLRGHITDVLDAEGFTYRAKDAWGFVEVTGRKDGEPITDGGVSVARTDGGGAGNGSDPHADVKLKVIRLDPIILATTVGEDGEYLAVYRDDDAPEDELDKYRLVMDLGDYTEVDPYIALDDDPGGVCAEGVTLDLWKSKRLMSDGGAKGGEGGADLETVVIRVLTGFGDSARVVPSGPGVLIEYKTPIYGRLADALDLMGVSHAREARVVRGPAAADSLGLMRVTGFRSGGGRDD